MTRKRQPDPRTVLVDGFPVNAPPGRAVLYAIGFADGLVKFGKATQPRARLRRLCCINGASAVWAHVFGPIDPPAKFGLPAPAEREALRLALGYGRQAKKSKASEYVIGLTKQQAIACGRAARQMTGLA